MKQPLKVRKAEPVSREKRWAEAQKAGQLRYNASMFDFHDEAGAVQVAVGAARQHMLRSGYQPDEFAAELQDFETALHELRA